MPGQRPYFQKKINELKALFEASRGNRPVLKALAEELTHRNMPKASELGAEVDDALAHLRSAEAQAVGDNGLTRTAPRVAAEPVARATVLPFPVRPTLGRPTTQPRAHKLVDRPKPATQSPVRPTEDLSPLSTFATPNGGNEPRAVLAAWTALEALSPRPTGSRRIWLRETAGVW